MAPWVNDLLYKHEKLTLDPHHPHETQAWWEAPVATALGQQSQMGLRGSPASLTTLVVSRWTEELCLSKMRNSRGHHVALISVSLVCVCICVFLCFSLCISVSLSPSLSSLSHTSEIKEIRFKILKPWIAKKRAR